MDVPLLAKDQDREELNIDTKDGIPIFTQDGELELNDTSLTSCLYTSGHGENRGGRRLSSVTSYMIVSRGS
jgi:hypothetical protein